MVGENNLGIIYLLTWIFCNILSRPEIGLQKKKKQNERTEEKYEKRTQKDYSIPFKLSVVRKIETTSIGLSAV